MQGVRIGTCGWSYPDGPASSIRRARPLVTSSPTTLTSTRHQFTLAEAIDRTDWLRVAQELIERYTDQPDGPIIVERPTAD